MSRLAMIFSIFDDALYWSSNEVEIYEGYLSWGIRMTSDVSPIPELVQRGHVTTNKRVRCENLMASLSLGNPFCLESMEVLRLFLCYSDS